MHTQRISVTMATLPAYSFLMQVIHFPANLTVSYTYFQTLLHYFVSYVSV
jgi:hypothetical protein